MNKLALLCLCVFGAVPSRAMDLKQSKLTQVVNEVQIISAADQVQKAAAVNDVFAMPDLLRTGAASRAELVAPDETVTRVGANTIFSFDPANRTLDLKQGSLLFHSPHGKGGGTIHTGSATASVLGTTLIVVTTPNGGFKVIDLEGHVKVTLTNSLSQKLNPGEMTFVLPGANQLAPVVVFRLDELVQNSLLVKGFTQTLDSLPLIDNQIVIQQKQISSGLLGDTGLVVGDNATPNQVEVLDLNTISGGGIHNDILPQPQSPPKPPSSGNNPNPPSPPPVNTLNLSAAEAADATINQSSLTDSSIPTPPLHVLFSDFGLTGNGYFHGQTFSGFVADNIYFNTLVVTPDARIVAPLEVALSSYSKQSQFDMVSVNDMYFDGSVQFSGLAPSQTFALIVGNQLSLSSGISLEADAENFLISSPAAMTFDGVSLLNAVGDINVDTAGEMTFLDGASATAAGRFIISAGGDVSATDSSWAGTTIRVSSLSGGIPILDSSLTAANNVILLALDDITIGTQSQEGDSAPNGKPRPAYVEPGAGSSLTTDPSSGSITMLSTVGSINISDTQITTHYLTLNSGDNILLDCTGHMPTATGTGAKAVLTAGNSANNSITVNNTDFSQFSVVNMSANTIDLCNVNFGAGSKETFNCFNGVLAPYPNTGATPIQGDVNFINNVTYNWQPAQTLVGTAIFIGKN